MVEYVEQVALEAPCSSALGILYQHQTGIIAVAPRPESGDTEPVCNETNILPNRHGASLL